MHDFGSLVFLQSPQSFEFVVIPDVFLVRWPLKVIEGQETVYTTQVLKNDIFPKGPDLVGYLTSSGEPIPLIFTIWGADGFMVSRNASMYFPLLQPFLSYGGAGFSTETFRVYGVCYCSCF